METNNPPKQRIYLFWLGIFSRVGLLIALPLLFYYGYCWGLWGRHSLLLQYLFQCNCPPASAEARYPYGTDVIVAACNYNSSILSPGGRFLVVYENEPANASPHLLDLQTGENIPMSFPEKSALSFLTEDLLYLSLSFDENYIFDRTNGSQYSIQRFSRLRQGAYVAGYADLDLLAEYLRAAQAVYFMDQGDTIVALDPDFPTSAEKNFMIDWLGIPGRDLNRTERFLIGYGILYQTIPRAYPEEVVSPDRRFVARPDGIYLLSTGQRILEAPAVSGFYRAYSRKYFDVRGWTYDGAAVIYSEMFKPCVIETALLSACLIKVPQPVLKLNVPEEYLQPNQTP